VTAAAAGNRRQPVLDPGHRTMPATLGGTRPPLPLIQMQER